MKRVQLLTGYELLPTDKEGLLIRLSEPGLSAEIMKLALGRKIRPVTAVKIEKAIWSDKGADYFSSNKSKWMDAVTGNLAILNVRRPVYFGLNRSYLLQFRKSVAEHPLDWRL